MALRCGLSDDKTFSTFPEYKHLTITLARQHLSGLSMQNVCRTRWHNMSASSFILFKSSAQKKSRVVQRRQFGHCNLPPCSCSGLWMLWHKMIDIGTVGNCVTVAVKYEWSFKFVHVLHCNVAALPIIDVLRWGATLEFPSLHQVLHYGTSFILTWDVVHCVELNCSRLYWSIISTTQLRCSEVYECTSFFFSD